MARSRLSVVMAIAAIASATLSAAEPITDEPWREAVLSVTDPDVTARFFKEIGGYEELGRGTLSASSIAAWGLAPEASGEYPSVAPRWGVILAMCVW